MRNVCDEDILICTVGYNAGKVYTVIASNEELFVTAETQYDVEKECYHIDLNKLSAYCNCNESMSLKELGFSKTYPRLY